MAAREHLDTYESEDHDLAFSVYRIGGKDIELWIQVAGAHLKLPAESVGEMQEMLTAIQEYLEELNDE